MRGLRQFGKAEQANPVAGVSAEHFARAEHHDFIDQIFGQQGAGNPAASLGQNPVTAPGCQRAQVGFEVPARQQAPIGPVLLNPADNLLIGAFAVVDHAHGRVGARDTGDADSKARLVLEYRLGAGQQKIRLRPQHVAALARFGAGDPLAGAVGQRDLAVQRKTKLERQMRQTLGHAFDETGVQRPGFGLQHPDFGADP